MYRCNPQWGISPFYWYGQFYPSLLFELFSGSVSFWVVGWRCPVILSLSISIVHIPRVAFNTLRPSQKSRDSIDIFKLNNAFQFEMKCYWCIFLSDQLIIRHLFACYGLVPTRRQDTSWIKADQGTRGHMTSLGIIESRSDWIYTHSRASMWFCLDYI